jgi:hypothetical protein
VPHEIFCKAAARLGTPFILDRDESAVLAKAKLVRHDVEANHVILGEHATRVTLLQADGALGCYMPSWMMTKQERDDMLRHAKNVCSVVANDELKNPWVKRLPWNRAGAATAAAPAASTGIMGGPTATAFFGYDEEIMVGWRQTADAMSKLLADATKHKRDFISETAMCVELLSQIRESKWAKNEDNMRVLEAVAGKVREPLTDFHRRFLTEETAWSDSALGKLMELLRDCEDGGTMGKLESAVGAELTESNLAAMEAYLRATNKIVEQHCPILGATRPPRGAKKLKMYEDANRSGGHAFQTSLYNEFLGDREANKPQRGVAESVN